jgi:hypothetical protein
MENQAGSVAVVPVLTMQVDRRPSVAQAVVEQVQ